MWMMLWDKCCEPDIFRQHKVNMYPQQQYTKTKSTIFLAENGITSSSKRTCHINVWYFLVANKIKKGR